MALRYHPDKNPNAGDKFQEISKAYQILSNEDSKLFFDSFGYDGLILNEKLNSKGEHNLMEWLISISFCLLSVVLDWIFGIYTEWIFASMFTLYFIYLTKRSPDIAFCLFIVISNLVLYFIMPTRILPTVTNIVIYGIVLLWPNITKKNSSLTVVIWIGIIVFDLWRGIRFNHWIWRILSLNIIIFGSIILMLMGIYVLKKPETGFNAALLEKSEQIIAEQKLADPPTEAQRKKILMQKCINQTMMGVIFLVIQYFINFSTEKWFLLGSMSLGYSFVLMIELYFFSFSIKSTDEEVEELAKSMNKSKQSTALQPYSPNSSPTLKPTSPSSSSSSSSSTYTSKKSKKVATTKSALDKRCQTCYKSADLKKCSRCQQVYYCSKECQIKNWQFHRSICG
eukprot:gene7286-8468_t